MVPTGYQIPCDCDIQEKKNQIIQTIKVRYSIQNLSLVLVASMNKLCPFPVKGPEDGWKVQQLQGGAQSQTHHCQQALPVKPSKS
jgi:hypothetical protein